MTTFPGDEPTPETMPVETDAAPVPTAATAAQVSPRRRPRFAPIFWGVVLLAFAVYVVVARLLPTPPDPTFWLLGGIIAVGLTLVVAGIAAAVRRAG
ncbi:hypothetical protein GY21_04210 [Cryobacterium roopkundense]|uniref:Uncharacterized protein n=1 Tax=Cryobacterium roopkundense TaxID=1001240 RepID=A0A099JQM8_9MICO|nr:hypothetical protein [Cryobacterium roopkundense]KGJ79733.1 hypothetical protein GY21_04210 [Cryobacterium roopkundense]MBB5642722.1 hypothetical protein [Cryobacterium roopkundense]